MRDAWATGAHCQLLDFRTPGSHAGYGLQLPGYHSWGGGALFDGQEYHLLLSFMCNHGSLSEWTTVSSMYRATSSKPEGPYTMQEMIAQPWSRNVVPTENPAGSGCVPAACPCLARRLLLDSVRGALGAMCLDLSGSETYTLTENP